MLRNFLVIVLLSVLSSSVFALERKVFCVWDPVGRNGPVMSFYSDLIPKAQAWGLSIRFVAYTDERVAAKDFKEGRCEAVLLTSILARQFVKFGGTMDAIGAINSQKGLELALATLARPRAGELMTEGNYEVVATFPVGSMYAFVRDRSVNTIDAFAGKKLAILNGDPQMKKFADLASASQFDVTLASFAGQFNNGDVDIVIMPALAYNTFELYKGLGSKGGIIDYRLYYGMLQTIAKRDEFSTITNKKGEEETFGHVMRRYILTRMKEMKNMVNDAQEEIPKKYWIETNQFVKDDIDHFSKRVRTALRDDDVNHPDALKLFWKIRCRLDRSRGECKEPPPVKKDKREKPTAVKKVVKKKSKQLDAKKQQRLAQNRLEKKRKQETKLAQQRIQQEKLAKQKTEQKLLAQKLERERLEQQKLKQKQEEQAKQLKQERLEREKIEQALEREKKEREKLEKQLEEQKQEEQKKEKSSWWPF